MMPCGNLRLRDGKQIPYQLFEGEKSKELLSQTLIMSGIDIPLYYLYIFGMWYACGYDGWRGFILGKDEIHYLNLDGHWVKKRLKDGLVILENIPNEFRVPNFMGENIWKYFVSIGANPKFYWQYKDNFSLYSDCNEMRKTASFFLTQFFPSAWFPANNMISMLDGFFEKELIIEYESAFEYGIWMVNPFTWKVKTGPLSAPYYASFYDFIQQRPFASFPMNGYGKKRKKKEK